MATAPLVAYLPFVEIANKSPHNFLCVVVASVPKSMYNMHQLPSPCRLNSMETDDTHMHIQIMIQLYSGNTVTLPPFLFSSQDKKPASCTIENIYIINHVQKASFTITPISKKSIFFTVQADDQFGIRIDETEPTWYMKIKEFIIQKMSYFSLKKSTSKKTQA